MNRNQNRNNTRREEVESDTKRKGKA